MEKINMFDKIIKESIESHVQLCLERQSKGFKVVEIDVPFAYSSQLFALMNDELTYDGRLKDWQFGVFSSGEFEGKMGMTFVEDGMVFKKYFLKYTL